MEKDSFTSSGPPQNYGQWHSLTEHRFFILPISLSSPRGSILRGEVVSLKLVCFIFLVFKPLPPLRFRCSRHPIGYCSWAEKRKSPNIHSVAGTLFWVGPSPFVAHVVGIAQILGDLRATLTISVHDFFHTTYHGVSTADMSIRAGFDLMAINLTDLLFGHATFCFYRYVR